MKDNVSIITASFNGKKLLKGFLDSATNLDYPKDKYEIIVVDNGSTDGTAGYVKKHYPEVRLIRSKENLGFGKGNNLGMKNAKGELFFLVNNDTSLDKKVLKEVVSCYTRWSKKMQVGAVNTKLVLYDLYLPIKNVNSFFSNFKLPKTRYGASRHPFIRSYVKGTNFIEEVCLPIGFKNERGIQIVLTLKIIERNDYKICIGRKIIVEGEFGKKQKTKKVKIQLSKQQLKRYAVNLVQNAGNVYFRDGSGRDRGATVINYKQHYEIDSRQYDREEIIEGFCGAGVLLNKKALDKIGYFSNDFFMYYEDTDLSLRMKEEGWKVVYCPKALIRHIHAASSKEWSPFFVFNVERNRLLVVARHWPRLLAVKEWLKYIVRDTILAPIYYFMNGDKKKALENLRVRLRVNLSLINPFIIGMLRLKRLSNTQVNNYL